MNQTVSSENLEYYQLEEVVREDIEQLFQEVNSAEFFSYKDSDKKHINYLIPKLKEGMLLTKAKFILESDIYLLIDHYNPQVDFPNFPDLGMDHLFNFFNQGKFDYCVDNYETINGKRIIRLSETMKAKSGECLEKAVLTQLGLQEEGRISYICGGRLNVSGGENHAWNLVKGKDDIYRIWDPSMWYAAPISKIVTIEQKSRSYHGPILFLIPDYTKSQGSKIEPVYKIGPNLFKSPAFWEKKIVI